MCEQLAVLPALFSGQHEPLLQALLNMSKRTPHTHLVPAVPHLLVVLDLSSAALRYMRAHRASIMQASDPTIMVTVLLSNQLISQAFAALREHPSGSCSSPAWSLFFQGASNNLGLLACH